MEGIKAGLEIIQLLLEIQVANKLFCNCFDQVRDFVKQNETTINILLPNKNTGYQELLTFSLNSSFSLCNII